MRGLPNIFSVSIGDDKRGHKHVESGTFRVVFMRLVIICILLLTVTGCDWLAEDYEVINLDGLNKLKCEWQDPKESRWFYTGTEDGYHIFIHRDLPGDKHYKIKTSEFKIDDPMYVSSNEVNWVIMPWGPKSKECKP